MKPPAPGRLEIRDTEMVGLVLRVTAGGAMSWSVRTRTKDGKQPRPKLGTYPGMGIAAAHKAARLAIGGILAGADRVEDKRKAREARRHRLAKATMAERLKDWRDTRQANLESPWSARYAVEVDRICDRDLIPPIGKRALAETTRADWTALIAAKRKGAPAMAAALYRVVSSFLNHAEAEGWIAAPLLPRKGAAKLAPDAEAPRPSADGRRTGRGVVCERGRPCEGAGFVARALDGALQDAGKAAGEGAKIAAWAVAQRAGGAA